MADVQAVLDMNSLAAFEQLLGGLTSVDNATRTKCEEIFNQCKAQPDVLCLQLVRALRTSAAIEHREMSSILLRRVLTKDEVSLWANLQSQTQDGIKGELLKSMQEETQKTIARKVRRRSFVRRVQKTASLRRLRLSRTRRPRIRDLLRRPSTRLYLNRTFRSTSSPRHRHRPTRSPHLTSSHHQVCDTVGELAAGIYDDGKWPELLPFLFTCVTQGQETLKESALNVFAQLAEYLGESLVPHLDTLHGILAQVRSTHWSPYDPVRVVNADP